MLINFFKKIFGIEDLESRIRKLERAKKVGAGAAGTIVAAGVYGKAKKAFKEKKKKKDKDND